MRCQRDSLIRGLFTMVWPKQQWKQSLAPELKERKAGKERMEQRRPSPPRSWDFWLKEATSLKWPHRDPYSTPFLWFPAILSFGLGPTMRMMEPTDINIVHVDSPLGKRPGCHRMEKVSREASQRHPA